MIGDTDSAKKLAKDVVVKAYSSLNRFNTAADFKEWLCKTAIVSCMVFNRKSNTA